MQGKLNHFGDSVCSKQVLLLTKCSALLFLPRLLLCNSNLNLSKLLFFYLNVENNLAVLFFSQRADLIVEVSVTKNFISQNGFLCHNVHFLDLLT